MSIDRSLKVQGALRRHRNVLTRAERIEQLKLEEKWSEEENDSVFGLTKVANRKAKTGKKDEKVVEEEGTEVVEGAEEAEAAPAAE